MKTLTKALKTMLDALAYADAGEYMTPSQKTEFLNRGSRPTKAQTVKPTVEQPAAQPRRRVALFMGSELPSHVMEYIIQTCVRLQHDLTVLTFESDSTARDLLKPHEGALKAAGIDMQLAVLTGNSMPQLARYLRSHPEIAFLACKETGYLGRSYLMGTQQKNALPVPVVVVVDNKEAVQVPEPQAKPLEENSRIA